VCGGRWGYLYEPVVRATLLVTGLNFTSQYAQFGVVEVGDSVVSVPTHVYDDLSNAAEFEMWESVGQFDRIILADVTTRVHELVVRDELQSGSMRDALRHPQAVSVLAIIQSDKNTGDVTRYNVGVDYVLDGGKVHWLSSEAPVVGSQYSVLYTANPTFLVLSELPQPRGVDGNPLPKRLHVRYADRVMEGAMPR
jgi:hypothetical protein